MATIGYIDGLLAGVDRPARVSLRRVFDYVLTGLRFGRPTDQTAAENFAARFYQVTTPASGGTEFIVRHGLGRTPYLLVPVLPVETVGAQLAPLTVTRAADATYLYLSSTATSAPLTVYVEA